jgi:hypothetical protein
MVVVAVAAACGWLYRYTKGTKAAPQLGFGQAASVTYIRREWGEYKDGSQQSGWAFEDDAGRLRFFTNTTPGVLRMYARRKGMPAGDANVCETKEHGWELF